MIGSNTYVHPSAIIYPNVVIGDNCHIGAGAVIGSMPEHKDFIGRAHAGVRIGNNVFVGALTTIDSGTVVDTIVENNIMILCHSHVGHDSRICDNAFISAGCILAGHTTLKAHASMGLRSVTKPHVTIWEMGMAGMGSVVTKNIPMGEIWVGNPCRFLKKNLKKIREIK